MSWPHVGVAMAAVLVAVVCVQLGRWQLRRHAERAARNAVVTARGEMPVLAIDSLPVGDSLAFRRVTASGAFDRGREIIELGRAFRGVPAVVVVTPLRLPGGGAVLVERGWAPSPDARAIDLGGVAEPESASVEGVLVPVEDPSPLPADSVWPLRVRRADPGRVWGRFPYSLAPLTLRRTVRPAGAPAVLTPVPVPAVDSGPHLAYAVQWFTFAAIALIGPLVAARVPRRRGSIDTVAPRGTM